MGIASSIHVNAPVGPGCNNLPDDVRRIQQRFNEMHLPPPIPYQSFPVDGVASPSFLGAIAEFQRDRMGMVAPTGRVDPTGATINALNGISHSAPPPAPTPSYAPTTGDTYFQEAIRHDPVGQSTWAEINNWLKGSAPGTIKAFMGSIQSVKDAREMLALWVELRKLIGLENTIQFFALSIAKNPKSLVFLAGKLGKSGSKSIAFLGKAAKYAEFVGIAITVIEVAQDFQKGDYSTAVSETYKFAMGKAIPWAGLIDTLQSAVEGLLPPNARNNVVFKILRSLDPVGLGAAGIDTIVSVVHMLIEGVYSGKIDESRMYRLISRLEKGPTAILKAPGEWMGDAIYKLLNE